MPKTIEEERKQIEELNAEYRKFCQPPSSREICESRKEGHAYLKDSAYYIIELVRPYCGITKYTFTTRETSNMLEIVTDAMKEGRLENVRKVSIKEYALAGGLFVPCCMQNCPYENPACIS